MKSNSNIGRLGEDLACEYLVKNGYRITDRNYRKPWGELDIIGKNPDGTLVFFEVKTLQNRGNDGLTPEDNLSAAKLKKLQRTCQLYVGSHLCEVDDERGWRLDLLTLTLYGKNCNIKHYKNITLT